MPCATRRGGPLTELPEHVRRNRAHWDVNAANYVAPGERNWASNEPEWGIWNLPESEIGMFPESLDGLDTIELGCGTAYVSSWMARRGARCVGIDNSEVQLSTARRLQQEHGVEFPLLHGNAEDVPYPDESFDFAISEYGASLWADPARWIRLLRSNGFEIEDLVEIRPAEGVTTPFPFVTNEWARRWPSEEAWKVRKAAAPV